MKNKAVIIGFILLVVLLVVVGVFFGRKAATPTPVPLAPQASPNPAFIPPPKVKFAFVSPPTIPASMPIYQFQSMTRASVESLAQQASTQLGLQATPSALQMTDTYTKTWTRPDQAQLVVTQTAHGITLSFQQVIAVKGVPKKTPVSAASDFIALFFAPSSGVTIQPTDISSGPFDGLLVLDPPTPPEYRGYNFRYAIGGYTIATEGLNDNSGTVVVDSAGTIRAANIVPPPSSIQQAGEVATIAPEGILVSLATGKGSLVNTQDLQDPSVGSTPTFSSFSIETTKIIYAAQGNQLFPALLLSGTGTSTKGATQKATFFLWIYRGDAANQ